MFDIRANGVQTSGASTVLYVCRRLWFKVKGNFENFLGHEYKMVSMYFACEIIFHLADMHNALKSYI